MSLPTHPSVSATPALPDDGEELQRAELYGLLARLWLAPPDAALLAQFAVAVTEAPQPGGALELPWHDLVAAMRASSVEAAAAEHQALFGGVGKPEVFLYASYHLTGSLNERPLVELRSDLAQLGLARQGEVEAVGMTEDHVAFLFEVMRYLIAGDEAAQFNLARQRDFFRRHLQPWIGGALCDAVLAQPAARLYAALAWLTREFMQIESLGFDLIE